VAFRLALRLPRDASTVPLVRRMLAQALTTLGVADECRDDIGLILTEACANVVEHAWDADDYEVSAPHCATTDASSP
jgi:serine/threonine-protein kinase RsbW